MEKILISACLTGEPVRYNGTGNRIENAILTRWRATDRLVPVCPEVCGGLPVPRPAAEIQGGDGDAVLDGAATVTDRTGRDVTAAFLEGARKALALAVENGCALAILTEKSPSCGSRTIHDGGFSGGKTAGAGVTSALLRRHGIAVFNQHEIEAAERFLSSTAQKNGDPSPWNP